MLFALKKILSSVLLPPGGFVLLFAVSALAPFSVRARRVLVLGSSSLLLALSLPAVSGRLVSCLEIPSDPSHLPSCDLIVLAGGGVADGVKDLSGEGALPAEAASRTAEAARLWHRLHVPIIACGGSVAGSAVEAEIAARYLSDLGVRSDDVILENRSRDTAENARFAAIIMREKRFVRPVLVTSSWHMRRAARAFERERICVVPWSAGRSGDRLVSWMAFLPSSGALKESSAAIREIAGLIVQQGR